MGIEKELLEVIKKKRKELGLSQKDMGDRMKISQVAYGKIEKGKSIKIDRLIEVCDVLGLSFYKLLRQFVKDTEFEKEKSINKEFTEAVSNLKTFYMMIYSDFKEVEEDFYKFAEGKVEKNDPGLPVDKMNGTLEIFKSHINYLNNLVKQFYH